MPQQLYAAIDVGGTKIAAALVDAGGTLLTRAELPTPSRGSGEEVMATVERLVDALAADPRWAAVAGLGIGSAGPVDPARGTVSPVNIPGWRDFPLVDRVRELAPVRGGEVVLVGDGSAMAAGEHWRGAARGYDNALCLVVSTGVGAGLILDGELRTGPSGNAGHLGHICVDVEGEHCPCGSRGCLEILASGTSIARWAVRNGWRASARADNVVETNVGAGAGNSARSAGGRATSAGGRATVEVGANGGGKGGGNATAEAGGNGGGNVTVEAGVNGGGNVTVEVGANGGGNVGVNGGGNSGVEVGVNGGGNVGVNGGGNVGVVVEGIVGSVVGGVVTAADIAASARSGNEIALAAFERAGRALAAGIASAAMLVDIKVAVIGGGVAKAGPLLFDPLRRHLATYASLPFTRDLAILPATLGGDAGLIGAAAVLAKPAAD